MAESDYQQVRPEHWAQLGRALPGVLSGDWREESLRNMQAAGHQLRVLVRDATPVAFAEFQWVVDECQLFNIAVLPDWQRRGLGLQLLTALLRESRQQRMHSCVLEVRESNLAARALYHKAGFNVTGRRPDYYPPITTTGAREAAVLYCRVLSEAD